MTTTGNLMQLALDLVGWKNIPGDSGIHVAGRRIERLQAGLDVDVGDLMLAKQAGYDVVLAHHPWGTPASLTAWQVYRRHTEFLIDFGVPRFLAEAAVESRVQELRVEAHRSNYNRVSGVAAMLEMPFLNIHSPQDELGRQMMQLAVDELLGAEPDATVGEVAAHLSASFIEFQNAPTRIAVRVGDPDQRAGRTVVVYGAFLEGSAAVARSYWEHGVSTVIYAYISPTQLKNLQAIGNPGNLIVTGHVATDSIGINAYLSALEEQYDIEVSRVSGIVSPDREDM